MKPTETETFKEKAINNLIPLFDSAFEGGEDGDELRDDKLAFKFATEAIEGLLELLSQTLPKKSNSCDSFSILCPSKAKGLKCPIEKYNQAIDDIRERLGLPQANES